MQISIRTSRVQVVVAKLKIGRFGVVHANFSNLLGCGVLTGATVHCIPQNMAGFVMLEAGGVVSLHVDMKNFLSQTFISDHIYQTILLREEFNVIYIQTM